MCTLQFFVTHLSLSNKWQLCFPHAYIFTNCTIMSVQVILIGSPRYPRFDKHSQTYRARQFHQI